MLAHLYVKRFVNLRVLRISFSRALNELHTSQGRLMCISIKHVHAIYLCTIYILGIVVEFSTAGERIRSSIKSVKN